MKYDFNNSQYAKFWDSREAATMLRKFVNDPDIISQRAVFWKSQFSVDPLVSPRGADGRAVFAASVRKREINNMLDMRAPLANTQPRDKQGLEVYTGTIPDFAAKGYVETGAERYVREQMFQEYFGNDAEILLQFADDLQAMVDEGNQTLSNMAAQALSTAAVRYEHGTGIHGAIYAAPLPAENRVLAGEKTWADPACKLLDQTEKIETDFRERTLYSGELKWQVTRDTFFNIILKNAQVVEYINNWRTINDKVVVNGWNINADMFNEAFKVNDKISPIEIVDESQKNGGVPVRGWADNTAVLRPVGYAGQIKRASILDQKIFEKYGSSIINKVFAARDIFTFVNTTLNNGELKEWHTDLFLAAVPVLEELESHIIVDIASCED